MEEHTNNHGKLLKTIVVVVLLGVVVYQVYSGIALKKMGIPGVLEVEFASAGETGPDDAGTDDGGREDAAGSDEHQAQAYTVADFTGRWVNRNPEAAITRAQIQQRLDQLVVHLWGKCHPSDCDWGTEQTASSDVQDGSLQLVWNTGFAVRRQEVRLLDDGRLGIFSNTEFTDNSGRPGYESVDYLERQ